MIAKLQNTDKLLLEHAYAQTRLYSTQLYTEDVAKTLSNAIKSKGTAAVKAIWGPIVYIVGSVAEYLGADVAIDLDNKGGAIGVNPQYLNGPVEFAVNFNNAAATTIFLAASIAYARAGNYIKSLICISLVLALVGGDVLLTSQVQYTILGLGGGALLVSRVLSKIASTDYTLKANKAIYDGFIVKVKGALEKGITKFVMPDFLKKILIKTLNGTLKDPVPPQPRNRKLKRDRSGGRRTPKQPGNVLQFPLQNPQSQPPTPPTVA